MRRRVAGAAVVAIAALASVALAGSAPAAKVATGIEIQFTAVSDGTVYVVGRVTSNDKRCLDDRKVKILLKRTAGGTAFVDTARSGRTGGWMGIRPIDEIADLGPFAGARLVMPERKVKLGKQKTLVCKGKTVDEEL